MKKIALIALLLITFCFAACTAGAGGGTKRTDSPQYLIGWDFDNRFGGGYDSVAETDAAYYYVAPAGKYLYYHDKQSGVSDVLCSKPECVHDSEPNNRSCNGYVETIGTLGCWGGRLHFLTATPESEESYALMSTKPDGTDRRVDTYTSLMIGDDEYSPQCLNYHRGKLYCWQIIERIIDGVPVVENCIFTIDPDTGELNKLYSVKEDFRYETPALFYFGKYVYFYFGRIVHEEDKAYTVMELRRWDVEKEELEEVFISHEEGFIGTGMRIWVESEDIIYIMPESLPEGEPNKLYKLEDGKLNTVVTFDTEGYGAVIGGAALVGYPDAGTMEIRRFDGSLIYEGEWELDFLSQLGSGTEASYHVSSVYGDENELLIGLLLYRKGEEHSMSFCLLRYDLTEGEPQATLLCYDPRN